MPPSDTETSKIKVEDMMQADGVKPSSREIQAVADDYYELITWKSYRSGFSRMFRDMISIRILHFQGSCFGTLFLQSLTI